MPVDPESLADVFRGVKLTFSKNCHSGIASAISPDHKCGCWRCRTKRGEPWNEETESQAEKDSVKAQKLFRESLRKASER